MTKLIAPVSPGEMLEEEFLVPLGMSKYRLAKSIGVPAQRIGNIISGKRGITAARTFASAASSACLMVGGCACRSVTTQRLRKEKWRLN